MGNNDFNGGNKAVRKGRGKGQICRIGTEIREVGFFKKFQRHLFETSRYYQEKY